MSDDIFGLLALALVAGIGYVMVRSFNARRGNTGSSHDGSAGYWSGSDISGPSAVSSRDSGSSGWFGGLFGSSDSSSGSSDSSSGSSDSSGSDSGGGGGGGD